MSIIKKIFGHCESCNKFFKYPRKERMNTKYNDDKDNYIVCCKKCIISINQCWDEQWREYYSGLL